MKHSLEINQSDKGVVYISICEVYVQDTEGNNRVYGRYLSEERAEEVTEFLHDFEDEEYKTAFWLKQCVFL